VLDPGRHDGASVTLAPGVVLYARGSAAPPLPDGGLALPVVPSSAFGDGSTPGPASCFSPDAWGRRFDLVVANILEGVLLELADTLAAALAPGGRLRLCGFTPLQTPALRAAYANRPLVLELQTEREGWAMLQLAKGGTMHQDPLVGRLDGETDG
jgi:hypothetical protein